MGRKYGKINKVNLDILMYNIGLLGESGIGKTTLIKEVCEKLVGKEGYIALDVGREDGHRALTGINTEPVEDWAKFIDITDDIIENKASEYADLKVVVIDTYDELCRLAEEESLRLYNKKAEKIAQTINGAWGGYGRGVDKAIELILNRLWELKKVGVQFIVIAHTKEKDKEDTISEEKYSQLTCNVSQKYFNAIKTKLHFLGVAYIDREIVKQKTSKKDKDGNTVYKGKIVGESRIINFRDDTFSIDSKSRFADIVDHIPLDSDAFIKALQDAILKEQSKSKIPLAQHKKDELTEANERIQREISYSKERRSKHADVDQNEEYIDIIKNLFPSATEDTQTAVRSVMGEYGIENFKNNDMTAYPTEGLKAIVDTLEKNNA